LTPILVNGSASIAISAVALASSLDQYPTHGMQRWRLAMRELSAEARLHFYARSLSRRAERGLHTAALYGAFALIAAVVFGTLSVRPF